MPEPALTPVDPAALDEATRAVLAGAPPLGLVGVVAHAPTALGPWVRHSGALLSALELDAVSRELVVLAVAAGVGSAYEWAQHVAVAGWVGVTEEQVEAVRTGSDAPFDDDQRAVLALARAAAAGGAGAGRPECAALVTRRGSRTAVEVLLVVGHYVGIARLLEAAGLPPEEPLDAARLGRAGREQA